MSHKFQSWLLGTTPYKTLQYVVNERLAQRSGPIGNLFKALEMGKREYSAHTLHRAFRVVNYFWMRMFQIYGGMRPVGTRFLSGSNGPLNYSGLFVYCFATIMVFARLRFSKSRDQYKFNS